MGSMNNFSELNKNMPVPLYYQLKQILIENIQNGNLRVGEAIPTENELCERFKISRPTVRQAIKELVVEGYLYRQKGKGTFVAKPKIEGKFFTKLQSYNDEILQKGMIPSTKVLNVSVIKGIAEINAELKILPEDKLILLKRLRFADNEPIVLVETYLPYEQYAGILNEDLTNNSLYALLEKKFGRKVIHVSRVIEAVNCTQNEAELLNIKKGSAVCLVHTVGYAAEELPVEYSIAWYRGDRNKFSVELYRD